MTIKKPKKKSLSAKPRVVKSGKATNKTLPTKQSVSDFLKTVENVDRLRDAKTLLAIFKKITGKKATMWGPSIIGFGQYHYVYESGREGDMLIVGFSPRKANMVLYVLGSINDDDPLLEKLGTYKTGRACLYIKKLEDVNLPILEQIIEKSFAKTIEKWGQA